jgi:O-antigen/teichoic acid export membrane protein
MPRDGLRDRIARAFGADVLAQALNVATRLLLVPLFLAKWGADAYGEWLILTALAAWFSLADLGGQLYFINRLTSEWATGNSRAFQAVLATGLLLFSISFVALYIVVIVVLNWLPIPSLLKLTIVSQDLATMILLIMAFRVLISLPVGLFLGVYRATGSQATSTMYGNTILLLQFIGSALALMMGSGMLVLAALELIPYLLVSIAAIWDLNRRFPKLQLFALQKCERSIFKAAISPSLHFLGLQFAQAIMIQGSVLVVARTTGPVQVAIYSSMRTVTNVVSRFIGMLSHAAWPEITRLAALHREEELTGLFKTILALTLAFGAIYLGLVIIFGESVFIWWLNNRLRYDASVMYLLGCQAVITALWTVGGNILMATNKHEGYAWWQVVASSIGILLCYFGAIEYGLSGSILGLILGQSIIIPFVIFFLLKRHGHRLIAGILMRSTIGATFLMTLIPFLRA